jgi:AcrR family transcriptional regulator
MERREIMPRVVKEHAVRRNEILDAAQRLVYSKGYEQMTIQDILDDLQISKGAFYHYFDSKQALLEALIERIEDEAEQVVLPIVHDPDLNAREKLQRIFDILTQWKTAQKDYILALWHVVYRDDNAIFREKGRISGIKRFTPLLTKIIQQGVQEGAMAVSYPDQTGEVILSLVLAFGDTLARLLLSGEPEHEKIPRAERITAAYTDALWRVLGMPGNSLQLMDVHALKEWFSSFEDNA